VGSADISLARNVMAGTLRRVEREITNVFCVTCGPRRNVGSERRSSIRRVIRRSVGCITAGMRRR
jgi:hypothetical protein